MTLARIRAVWHLVRGHDVKFDNYWQPPLFWCESCLSEWGPR